MSFDTASPYLAVYLYMKRGDTCLFVKRANTSWMDGYYGFPAGKVEKDEPSLQAAIREAREEVGVDITESDLKHVLTTHRKSPDMDWIDIVFEVTSWKGEPYNAEPHMHSEIAWLKIEDLPENIVPNNRYLLEQLLIGNSYAEFGWEAKG